MMSKKVRNERNDKRKEETRQKKRFFISIRGDSFTWGAPGIIAWRNVPVILMARVMFDVQGENVKLIVLEETKRKLARKNIKKD